MIGFRGTGPPLILGMFWFLSRVERSRERLSPRPIGFHDVCGTRSSLPTIRFTNNYLENVVLALTVAKISLQGGGGGNSEKMTWGIKAGVIL